MRDQDTLGLPPGYRLDLVGDPCVVTLCPADGTVVGRFTHTAHPEHIRHTAEEDAAHQASGRTVYLEG